MYTIYALVDPRTLFVHYVGITEKHPIERLIGHYQKGDKNPAKTAWLMELRALGIKPNVMILEQGRDLAKGFKREQYWIDLGLASGWKLFNIVGVIDKEIEETRPDEPAHTEQTNATSYPIMIYTPEPGQVYEPKQPAPRKWDEWIRAYMKEHPSLYQTPPVGVREMARQMSIQDTGSPSNMGRYAGLASATIKQIKTEQGAQDEQ